MLFARKFSVFRPSFIVACGFIIYGCASSGIQTPSGEQATNVIAAFERGEARLNCGVSCSGAWGSTRRQAKALYKQGLWKDLAIEVARVGFKADQTYFYLGRAAEELGLTEAALTYYKLGLASPYKCAGIINNCDGLVFPFEITSGINRLPVPIKAEAPIIASKSNLAGPRENISAVEKVSTESQPVQVSTPSEKIEPPQVDLRSTGREVNAKLQEEERLREAAKRKEQELRDQQTAQRLEREKEAKQQEDADRREAESKKKARAMVRKATTQERSLIIHAVNRTLFDSDSAKYRDIYLIPNSFACAEVNAKNRFGGYTGFQNVVATYISGEWFSVRSLRDIPISCLNLIAEMHIKNN